MTPTHIPDQFIEALKVRYAEPHRHYHTWKHIDDMLALSVRFRHLIYNPHLLNVAILYHDAVYDPTRHDNEGKSALLVNQLGGVLSVGEIAWVQNLIMATMDHRPAMVREDERADAQVLVDIDLSILGCDAGAFWNYEDGIRREYSFVSPADYREGRTKVLKSFLERPRIFISREFFEEFEEPARRNLAASVARLAGQ